VQVSFSGETSCSTLIFISIPPSNFLYGTDYRYFPPHQRTSRNQALTYDSLATAKADFLHRRCGKDYRVVCLKTIEIKRIIDFDAENCYEIYDEDWSDEGGEENSERNAGLVSMTSLMESRSRLTFALLVSWVIYSVFFRFSKVSTSSFCRAFRSSKLSNLD